MLSLNYIKEKVAEAAKDNGIGKVYLFGSYARGNATETSDVDLRVEDVDTSVFFGIGGFYEELNKAFGKIDVLTKKTGDFKPFWKNVQQEEILIYDKNA